VLVLVVTTRVAGPIFAQRFAREIKVKCKAESASPAIDTPRGRPLLIVVMQDASAERLAGE
jgi:hypothetical protein